MPNFAVITGNLVSNIIVADSKEIAESITKTRCEEVTEEFNVQVNWIYLEEEGIWISPEELYY